MGVSRQMTTPAQPVVFQVSTVPVHPSFTELLTGDVMERRQEQEREYVMSCFGYRIEAASSEKLNKRAILSASSRPLYQASIGKGRTSC